MLVLGVLFGIYSLLHMLVPAQKGSWLVDKICPYRHVAVFPPRLVYPT